MAEISWIDFSIADRKNIKIGNFILLIVRKMVDYLILDKNRQLNLSRLSENINQLLPNFK
jgi:hypothetical protein